VVLDSARLRRFLKETGFRLEDADHLARSPLFMLSVLNTATKDIELAQGLEAYDQISPELIALTQASLAFHVTVEVARQSGGAITRLAQPM
jgi:hypothetical protein